MAELAKGKIENYIRYGLEPWQFSMGPFSARERDGLKGWMDRPGLLVLKRQWACRIFLSLFLFFLHFSLLFFRCPEWKDKKDSSSCFLLVAVNEVGCTNKETGAEYHSRAGRTDRKTPPSGQS